LNRIAKSRAKPRIEQRCTAGDICPALTRREVILLRDMEQLTIGEVADHLRITREACKSRTHRGRALLREYLQGDKPRGGKK
jgi:hypothetical protein